MTPESGALSGTTTPLSPKGVAAVLTKYDSA
jgi:hypothetical protein